MITVKQLPPEPGMPKVEFIEPDLARWTFTSADREMQQLEFNYWCGWFGFDEDDEPQSTERQAWLIGRQR